MDHVFNESLTADDAVVHLSQDARRHLEALRIRDGEGIVVFNGKGVRAQCIVHRHQQDVSVKVETVDVIQQPTELVLAMGILDNRDRFEFAVEKATELGMTKFIPLTTQFSQRKTFTTDRLKAKAIAALTQSGNAWLPEIEEPTSIESAMNMSRGLLIIGDASGEHPKTLSRGEPISVFVGPEGGFSVSEIGALGKVQGAVKWRVGESRLRAETAAIVLLGNVVANRF